MIATLLLIPTELQGDNIVRSRVFDEHKKLAHEVDILLNIIRQSHEMENLVINEKQIRFDNEELNNRDTETIIGDILREDYTYIVQVCDNEGNLNYQLCPETSSMEDMPRDVRKFSEWFRNLTTNKALKETR